jgi:hypothetical protein
MSAFHFKAFAMAESSDGKSHHAEFIGDRLFFNHILYGNPLLQSHEYSPQSS